MLARPICFPPSNFDGRSAVGKPQQSDADRRHPGSREVRATIRPFANVTGGEVPGQMALLLGLLEIWIGYRPPGLQCSDGMPPTR